MAKKNNDKTEKDKAGPSDFRTVWVMQMGQFIDHDFAHSPNFPNITDERNITYTDCCCPDLDKDSPEYKERCFPIPIPEDDSFFKTIGRTCMDFHRAMPTPDLDCTLGNREQVLYNFKFIFVSAYLIVCS